MKQKKPLKVISYSLSDTGLVRENNEDAWSEVTEINFFVLADGMGGHSGGEIASKEAVNAVCDHFKQTVQIAGPRLSLPEAHGLMRLAIEHANETVYEMGSKNPALKGMGTTLCCLYCHHQGVIYAHVGDSRIYRLRQKKLSQITKDHSLVRELMDMGQIKENDAKEFLYKNIITKAVGTESVVDPTVCMSDADNDDVYLMCSDGLSDMLGINEIEQILINQDDIKLAAEQLISEANKKGGLDNITLVIIKLHDNNEKDLLRQ